MKQIKKSVWKIGFLITAALLATNPVLAIIPVPGTLPPSTPSTVNNGSSDQTDPHVSENLVSYTADTSSGFTEIRYFDFASGADSGIPTAAGQATDFLSDIGDSRIVFTRVSAGKSAIYLFDTGPAGGTPFELGPVAGSTRRSGEIGGDTVAWVDQGLSLTGEIVVHDLTNSTSIRLTNDTIVDRNPAVSPDGNVVVWEKCPLAICNIYKAVRSGTTWTVSPVTTTAEPEGNPDTNGTVVVYSSVRATSVGGSDIYWNDPKTATGAEQQLELAGVQRNPNISGNLIALESRHLGGSFFDLFVYDLTTNTLYQLTNTPTESDELNDISVLPSGLVRAVWAVNQADYNVYGLTFGLTRVYTNRTAFIQDALALTLVNFDVDPCGSPVSAIPPVRADSLWKDVGVTFVNGGIYPLGSFAASSPNVLSMAPPELMTRVGPNPSLAIGGDFATPVNAVGLTNIGAEAELVIADGTGQVIASATTDTTPLTKAFIGIITPSPIALFGFRYKSGLGFAADDLLFSTIRTPTCPP